MVVFRVLFFICFFILYVVAQNTFVVGYVIDENSGDPVSWVRIKTLSGKDLGQASSDGRFEVKVMSTKLLLSFTKFGYEDFILDLSDLSEFVDVEVYLSSKVKQLSNIDVFGKGIQNRKELGNQTIQELEQFQGLRIDLNDHLSQLAGISGIGEFSSDLSIFGGRKSDVVSYLGGTRIPNLRHLDFGLPGNQSVLNPRLLKSVSVEDNLSRGPVNQGNSSALQYQLKQAKDQQITGDIVFGTFNREFNATAFFGKRTFITSFRLIQPTFLTNISRQFFTIPKETRLDRSCNPAINDCSKLNENPIDVRAFDALFSTSYFDQETEEFSRWTFLALSDDFSISEDISNSFGATTFQTIHGGSQFKGFFSYEKTKPLESGSIFYSIGGLTGNDLRENRDTSLSSNQNQFYLASDGLENENLIGDFQLNSYYIFGSLQWTPIRERLNGTVSYYANLEYQSEIREFRDYLPENRRSIDASVYKLDGLFRWNYLSRSSHRLDFSIGLSQANFSELPAPLGNVRYGYQIKPWLAFYGDFALRQNHKFLKYNYEAQKLDDLNSSTITAQSITSIENKRTTSSEAKIGFKSGLSTLNFSLTSYYRYYFNPILPEPSVYWNFKELVTASSSEVLGFNFNLAWNLSPYFGVGSNVSVIQGKYNLQGGSSLAWEANRSLDWVLNLRLNPRGDSILSFIVTYVVNNDVPLYQYELPRDKIISSNNNAQFRPIDVGSRRIQNYKSVSRQRVDLRAHLNLDSQFKPLSRVRFYFQVTNLFSNFEQAFFKFLGGKNEKQRGVTRLSEENLGNLTPVLIRGLGFFIIFGFELNFST